MIYASLILLSAAWLLASAQTRRSPLTVLVRAALYLQATVLWLRRYGWPAIKREVPQFAWCVDEARRRAWETKPVVARQAPKAAVETVALSERQTSGAWVDCVRRWFGERRTA